LKRQVGVAVNLSNILENPGFNTGGSITTSLLRETEN